LRERGLESLAQRSRTRAGPPTQGCRRAPSKDGDLIDSVDLGAAARTENYEIAAYEGLRRMAKALGEDEAVDLLDANLKEEKEALRQVEKIATRVSNEAAKAAA
jgi:ferritin-like metal-binding protein YciE